MKSSTVVKDVGVEEFIRASVAPARKHAPQIAGFRLENRQYQTRFHFRMDRCIGCHCCEVACSEQNGLPPEAQWRRVGEIEGGVYPESKRYYLSSGCNHCLDAPCMKGCPVDAYRVNERGIVIHLDQTCIGCQYCTWNCPYGVPVYQEDRKIVTKCDLCSNRLDQNLDPACVEACPAQAILIETVPVEDVLAGYTIDAKAPDMPPPEISIPSTKITLPSGMESGDFKKTDRPFVRPEHPHTPLIWMTCLTQMALGSFLMIFAQDVARFLSGSQSGPESLAWFSPAACLIALTSLAASTLHLGRPLFAYRAVKMWRTSWLSREVITLSLFAFAAIAYSALLFFAGKNQTMGFEMLSQARLIVGSLTIISGIAGIYSSSMIYRVPSRPAWNSGVTNFDFFSTCLITGPSLFAFAWSSSSCFSGANATLEDGFAVRGSMIAVLFASAFSLAQAGLMNRRSLSPVFELKATAELYCVRFWRLRFFRNVALLISLFCWLSLESGQVTLASGSGCVATALEFLSLSLMCLINRYLFFVTVVPRNIPGNFIMAAHQYNQDASRAA